MKTRIIILFAALTCLVACEKVDPEPETTTRTTESTDSISSSSPSFSVTVDDSDWEECDGGTY